MSTLLFPLAYLHWVEVLGENSDYGRSRRETSQIRRDLENPCDKLVEGKRHIDGCLHSDKPDVIVSTTFQKANRGIMTGEEAAAAGDLLTSLYFKRCDGSFKNVRGEMLIMDAQG